jgi:hypothetical protein
MKCPHCGKVIDVLDIDMTRKIEELQKWSAEQLRAYILGKETRRLKDLWESLT